MLPAGPPTRPHPAPAPRALPIISEHQVILGTVAATAVTPSFQDEDGVADDLEVPARSGWMATLLRRITPSGNSRRHYSARKDSEFMMDARIAREMHRL